VSQCDAVCYSVMQCVAVILQCCFRVLQSPRIQHFKAKVLSSSVFACCSCRDVFFSYPFFFLCSDLFLFKFSSYSSPFARCTSISLSSFFIFQVYTAAFFACASKTFWCSSSARMQHTRRQSVRKEAHNVTKDPYTYTKETHKPTKVFCVCKNARYEAPRMLEKRPTTSQKRPTYSQKRPAHTQKCSVSARMPDERRQKFQKRGPQCHKRDLHIHKRDK